MFPYTDEIFLPFFSNCFITKHFKQTKLRAWHNKQPYTAAIPLLSFNNLQDFATCDLGVRFRCHIFFLNASVSENMLVYSHIGGPEISNDSFSLFKTQPIVNFSIRPHLSSAAGFPGTALNPVPSWGLQVHPTAGVPDSSRAVGPRLGPAQVGAGGSTDLLPRCPRLPSRLWVKHCPLKSQSPLGHRFFSLIQTEGAAWNPDRNRDDDSDSFPQHVCLEGETEAGSGDSASGPWELWFQGQARWRETPALYPVPPPLLEAYPAKAAACCPSHSTLSQRGSVGAAIVGSPRRRGPAPSARVLLPSPLATPNSPGSACVLVPPAVGCDAGFGPAGRWRLGGGGKHSSLLLRFAGVAGLRGMGFESGTVR